MEASMRLHLTRALIFEQSVITGKFGAIKYSPLESVVMIPPYFLGYTVAKVLGYDSEQAHQVGYRASAFVYNPLVTTATCVVYFKILRIAQVDVTLSLISTFLLLFGTLSLPHSRIMFSEPLSGGLILASVYFVVVSVRHASVGPLLLTAMTLALLCLNNPVFIPLFVAVAGYLIVYWYRRHNTHAVTITATAAAFALSLSLVLWGVYNYARYGHALALGYTGEGFDNPLPVGLYGLLFSVGRGIVFYSPLTVLAFVYFVVGRRQVADALRNVLSVYLALGVGYLFIFAKWHSFEGGWTWGPRFLLPFVPVIHLVFPFLLERYKDWDRLKRVLLVGLCSYAVLINAYEFIGVYQKYEVGTFKSGAIPYRFSIFLPEYSALLNNWEWRAFVTRFPQFIAVTAISFYGLMFLYRTKVLNEGRGKQRPPRVRSIRNLLS